MVNIIKPPNDITETSGPSIFLAGTIDMGNSTNWQSSVEQELSDIENLTIFNPRRESWDSSWIQSTQNPQFVEQVVWELNAMEKADLIFMYLLPGSQSPITLLEMGIHATSKKLLVCCPDGFYRKGNVDIVCKHFDIPQVDNIDAAIKVLRSQITHK